MEIDNVQPKRPKDDVSSSTENAARPSCPFSTERQSVGTVCTVCGHINKGQSLICEMCSNYLFD